MADKDKTVEQPPEPPVVEESTDTPPVVDEKPEEVLDTVIDKEFKTSQEVAKNAAELNAPEKTKEDKEALDELSVNPDRSLGEVEARQREINPDGEVWGLRAQSLNPEESPYYTNGYVGVDPNFQR